MKGLSKEVSQSTIKCSISVLVTDFFVTSTTPPPPAPSLPLSRSSPRDMEGSFGFLVETALRSLVVVLAALSPVVVVGFVVVEEDSPPAPVFPVAVAVVAVVAVTVFEEASFGFDVDDTAVLLVVLSDAATASGCCEGAMAQESCLNISFKLEIL